MEDYNELSTEYRSQSESDGEKGLKSEEETSRPYLSFSIDCILGNKFGRRRRDSEVDQVLSYRSNVNCRDLVEINEKSCPCDDCLYIKTETISNSLRYDTKIRPDINSCSTYDWLQCTRYKPPKVPSK